MLRYAVISSGSCGNCYIFTDETDSIIIDFGISTKRVLEFLNDNSISPESVRAIFITHLHPDHASSSIKVFQKKYPAPLYLNNFAMKREHSAFISLNLQNDLVRNFCLGDVINVSNFKITPIEAMHDSQGCVSYRIEIGGKIITLITDTGYFTQEMLDSARDSDLLFLESDYDDKMLDEGDYTPELKSRIRSDKGHLSNDQALRFLTKIGEKKDRMVYLIHLSENNNKVEIAQERISPALSLNLDIKAIEHGGNMVGNIN